MDMVSPVMEKKICHMLPNNVTLEFLWHCNWRVVHPFKAGLDGLKMLHMLHGLSIELLGKTGLVQLEDWARNWPAPQEQGL